MKKQFILLITIIAILLAGSVYAAECPGSGWTNADCGCTADGTSRTTYTMDNSIICTDSDGVIIGANSITLDCAGYSITGEKTGYPSITITGVILNSKSGTTVKNCNILGFDLGVDATNSNNNLIYNNYFDNLNNAYDNGSNDWNSSYNCTAGPNIVDGCCIGGNFWANYVSTGFSETCADADYDGICDSAYSVPGGSNYDYYPLTITDSDGDGIQDCRDKCLNTTLPESIPTDVLRPNHYAEIDGDFIFETNTGTANKPVIEDSQYSLVDSYGCSCEQILYCKPGNNNGEYNWGCTQGTMNVWTSQMGWSLDCQADGKVAIEGEQKDLLENTDGDNKIDAIDKDNDNDRIKDSEDSEPDSKKLEPGTYGDGKPNWWCSKHPDKC